MSARGVAGIVAVCLAMVATTACAQSNLLDKILKGASSLPGTSSELSTSEIGAGLKEALTVGTESVVSRLGSADGFNGDPKVHIPLPKTFKSVQSALGAVGMSSQLDELELRLNRAAETAAPKAKRLFVDAISEMTFDDTMKIYQGPNDAATQYLRRKMSAPLASEMRPVVDTSLADVGAVQTYNDVMASYNALPLAPKVDTDLSDYVVEQAMGGMFLYLAEEEAAIRKNPVKRTTQLLQKVFSSSQ